MSLKKARPHGLGGLTDPVSHKTIIPHIHRSDSRFRFAIRGYCVVLRLSVPFYGGIPRLENSQDIVPLRSTAYRRIQTRSYEEPVP